MEIIRENIQKYQNDLEIRLSHKEIINQMDINQVYLYNIIKTDITKALKKTCSTSRKFKQTKISKETKDLMEKRRNMTNVTTEHKKLNKIIKIKIKDDLRQYNTELVKQITI